MSINFGFHRRSSVLDVHAGGVHNARATYDAARIAERSRVLGYAIAARQLRFPDAPPYRYAPFAERGELFVWDDQARNLLHDYNLLDLSI